MAGSARDIKRRIRGISNIKQITNTMELVSTSKLRRAREQLEKSRPYYHTVIGNIQNVLATVGPINHPLLEIREVKKSLYIILGADRGLAGGYNSNIIRLAESKIKDKIEDNLIITVGVKPREYFRRRNYNIVEEFVNITEEPKFSDARRISQLALKLYENKEVDEINIVYTRFLGTLNQEPRIIKLLPSMGEEEFLGTNIETEFEPSPKSVLDYLIPKYVESAIYGALIESSSSEQAARRLAMEAATENAEEMIDELNISYNRARQAAITREISEIVTGAEALK